MVWLLRYGPRSTKPNLCIECAKLAHAAAIMHRIQKRGDHKNDTYMITSVCPVRRGPFHTASGGTFYLFKPAFVRVRRS